MYYSDVLFYPKNEGLLVTMLGFYLSVLWQGNGSWPANSSCRIWFCPRPVAGWKHVDSGHRLAQSDSKHMRTTLLSRSTLLTTNQWDQNSLSMPLLWCMVFILVGQNCGFYGDTSLSTYGSVPQEKAQVCIHTMLRSKLPATAIRR